MKKLSFYLSFMVLFYLLLSAGCTRKKSELSFDIVYSGYLLGTIAPCNCPHTKAGGLPRHKTAIDTHAPDSRNRLVLDAGNFSAIRPDIGPAKTEILLAGLMRLKHVPWAG